MPWPMSPTPTKPIRALLIALFLLFLSYALPIAAALGVLKREMRSSHGHRVERKLARTTTVEKRHCKAAACDDHHAGHRERVGKLPVHNPSRQRRPDELHIGERRDRRRRRMLEREDEQEVPERPEQATDDDQYHMFP